MSRRRLIAAEVDRHTIQRWLGDGRLRAVHAGVYAVGHVAPSLDGDYMAAALASGGSVPEPSRAAYELRLLRGAAAPPPETTVATTAHRRRPGVVIHRVAALHVLDVAKADDIPITTVPRVLLDLARTTAYERLARLCHEAWVRHERGLDRIEACIARKPHKPGAAKLCRALGPT